MIPAMLPTYHTTADQVVLFDIVRVLFSVLLNNGDDTDARQAWQVRNRSYVDGTGALRFVIAEFDEDTRQLVPDGTELVVYLVPGQRVEVTRIENVQTITPSSQRYRV